MEYGILGIILFLIYKLMNKKTANQRIYDSAFSLIGETEIKGALHNPKILEMTSIYGFSNDDIHWCSCFVAYCVQNAGISLQSTTAMAVSWKNWGFPTSTPKLGDIAVFWRETPSSGLGHVGIVESVEDGVITMISGNSSDAVRMTSESFTRLIGFRTIDTKNITLNQFQ